MTVVICEGKRSDVSNARIEGDHLWLPLADLERVTGWTLKPEGVCQDDVCIPLPPGGIVQQGAINLSSFWQYMKRPVVSTSAKDVWLLEDAGEASRTALVTGQAPDFVLPDLNGKEHSLSDYRGAKVFLTAWASW